MNNKTTKINTAIFVLITLIAFSSCTSTRMTISPNAYQSTLNKIDTIFVTLPNDYHLIGTGSDVKNDIVVIGSSYSSEDGYQTQMGNNFSTYENYIYKDSLGNSIEFQIKYNKEFDTQKKVYVKNIKVVKCICDDRELYEEVCGEDGIVKSIEQLNPDQKSTFFDSGKSAGLLIGSILFIIIVASIQ